MYNRVAMKVQYLSYSEHFWMSAFLRNPFAFTRSFFYGVLLEMSFTKIE